jgi:hypothetical protein
VAVAVGATAALAHRKLIRMPTAINSIVTRRTTRKNRSDPSILGRVTRGR